MTDVRATTALTETLAAINLWYPATAQPARVQASQIRAPYGSKPPISIDVISLRRDTRDTLTGWAWRVHVGRNLTGTIHATIPVLTSFLARHAEWLVDNHRKDPQRALAPLATRLEHVAKQSWPRVVRPGPCPEKDDTGNPCPGKLTAIVRKSDDALPSALYCSVGALHEWAPHEWIALGRRLIGAGFDNLLV